MTATCDGDNNSIVYESLDFDRVEPEAVVFLGSPFVTQYEIDAYLKLWKRFGGQYPTSGRLIPFLCSDGSWYRLASNSASSETPYPFHISCGDMDSQPLLSSEDPSRALHAASRQRAIHISTHTVSTLEDSQLDSISQFIHSREETPVMKEAPYVMVPVTDDQDSTDFDKCLDLVGRLADFTGRVKDVKHLGGSQKPPPLIVVLGALGGRFDHSMGVVASMIRRRSEMRVVVHNSSNTLFCCATHGLTEFYQDPALDGSTCGAMVFGEATSSVVTTGLKWNLGDPQLVTGFLGMCLSTSNSILPPPTPTSSSTSSDGADTNTNQSIIKGSKGRVTIDTSALPNGGSNSAVVFCVSRAGAS